MRLKKVPKGTKHIFFTNESITDCIVYVEGAPLLCVRGNSIKYISCDSFFCELPPPKEFPTWQFYSNIKIELEFK